jgi:hypothetical protein
MNIKTAQLLTEAVEKATNLAIENQNKIVALEKTLQEHDSNLFQAYSKILDEIRRNPPTSLFPPGFLKLELELVRDRS